MVSRLSLAVIFVTVAFLLTLGLQQLAPRVYFILFVPAVMFSTWFGGRSAGMLASALTVVATILLLPRSEVADQLAWIVVAGIVTLVTSAVTAERRRVEADLTARAEEELSRRLDAESLSQLKTDVLVQVAHELSQPLSAMAVALQMLQKTSQSGSGHDRAIGVLGRQTDHLRRLVDDLVDLSRLTRQELQLLKSEIDLCQIVDDTVHVIASEVAARGLDLSTTMPPCPVSVTADPTRVHQILSNLLSNAVKFTPAGGKVDLALEPTPSGVVIRVRDTGRGIPPDRLPYIFDLFHKGSGDGAGLGVGLAVVKGLAEMHGGSVEARSDGVGSGSEFIVTLPAPAERPAA